MDYLHPLEALIPGARGQVLAALTRNTSAQTIRQVSLDAGVSWSRTSEIIDDLAALGIVERRRTPGGVLVRLADRNVATGVLQTLSGLGRLAIESLRREAVSIRPAPLTLTVFGSFARGEARRDSDVDVLAVRDPLVDEPTQHNWLESIGGWTEAATAITGNPVNLIDLALEELNPQGRKRPEWLRAADEDGILLAGHPLDELLARRGRKVRA